MHRCKSPRDVQALLDNNFEAVCGFGVTRLVVIGEFFNWGSGLQTNLSHHAFVLLFVDAWHVLLVDAQQQALLDKVRVWSGSRDSCESARAAAMLLGFSKLYFYMVEATGHSYGPVLDRDEFLQLCSTQKAPLDEE